MTTLRGWTIPQLPDMPNIHYENSYNEADYQMPNIQAALMLDFLQWMDANGTMDKSSSLHVDTYCQLMIADMLAGADVAYVDYLYRIYAAWGLPAFKLTLIKFYSDYHFLNMHLP